MHNSATPHFKFFPRNPRGRDFVVGDIHGTFSLLERLLRQVNFQPRHDRVFSVGDLIDRGTESTRVTEFLDQPWFYAIIGNHEQMLLEGEHDQNVYRNWIQYNGGNWWKHLTLIQQQAIRETISRLPTAIEVDTATGRVGIVHADIPLGVDWKSFIQNLYRDSSSIEYALWSRNRFRLACHNAPAQYIEGITYAVFGHNPTPTPFCWGNAHYIDTGAALDEIGYGTMTLLQIHPTYAVHSAKHDVPPFA